MQKAPYDDPQDIPASTMNIFKFGGKQYGIPMRVASLTMHANVEYFKERGVPFPPKTIEELYDAARKLTFTKPDGEKVYGLVRLLDAPGHRRVSRGLRQGLAERRTTYPRITRSAATRSPSSRSSKRCGTSGRKGPCRRISSPSASTTPSPISRNGRAAMIFGASAYYGPFNDPKVSKVAGKAKVFAMPPSKDSPAQMKTADGVVNVWSMVIPKGAADKNLSWDFVRTLSGKQQSLQMALNGNGPDPPVPVRRPEIRRGPLPGSDRGHQERHRHRPRRLARLRQRHSGPGNRGPGEIHLALLGKKSPQQAMDDAAKELKNLVPKK